MSLVIMCSVYRRYFNKIKASLLGKQSALSPEIIFVFKQWGEDLASKIYLSPTHSEVRFKAAILLLFIHNCCSHLVCVLVLWCVFVLSS